MFASFFPPPVCPKHGQPLIPTRPRTQLVCGAVLGCDYYERIDPLKLFNVIVIWDVYAVAKTPEAAIEATAQWIKSGDLPASSQNALETRENRQIRADWMNEKPIVGEDLSDEEFESLKGKTTLDAFNRFYSKRG